MKSNLGNAFVDPLDVSFRFTVSAVATLEVGHKPYLLGFEKGVVQRLRNIPFTSSLGGLVLFPTICDRVIVREGDFADFVSYKRSSNDAFVGINIPYDVWMRASPFERIDLMAANLKTSVERISPRRLNEEDRCLLLDAIEKTRVALHTSILRD